MPEHKPHSGLKHRIHTVIFEADTPAGKRFDIALIIFIILSLIGMMLESVKEINEQFETFLRVLDWVITILFTIEYFLRIYSTGKPMKYILSFYGIIDLLAILPTYFSMVFGGAYALSVIRAIRLLRVFRVLKLVQFVGEAQSLTRAVKASMRKIVVFIIFILTITMIIGAVMYIIEGPENGFTSIPKSIYWAIVTLTTVGYGDITPHTALGQTLAAMIMILGYGVIAVPTGIMSAEVIRDSDRMKKDLNEHKDEFTTKACPECSREGHAYDAIHCKFCGAFLE